MLSDRQQLILRLVVDAYVSSGRPVASRAIADSSRLEWGPSTVRAELAALEDGGYLSHPHTSAGRVPTDTGYRFYVDQLASAAVDPKAVDSKAVDSKAVDSKAVDSKAVDSKAVDSMEPNGDLELSRVRREVDEAMLETTRALSQVTDLLALVTAPPLGTATIHRVEALLLQPNLVMVVVITSAGDVTKRAFNFDKPVDQGLVKWASSYLNENLAGMGLGARMIASRLSDPGLGPVEAAFLERLSPALIDLEQEGEESIYVEGRSHLLAERRSADVPHIDRLMRALESRANVLRMLRTAMDEHSVFLWIGDENPDPELRSVSVVGANYGLAHRNLGSVGVVGPMRMDYPVAIASVREASRELSRYFESVYEA